MTAPRIAALVVGPGGSHEAVAAQAPGAAAHPGPWPQALLAAADADWLWLVRGDTVPAAGALSELRRVAEGVPGLRPPALLASKVIGVDGRLDPGSAPWPPLHDRAGAMNAAEHRLAAVRIARWGSLLVRGDVLRRHAPPREDLAAADDLEWTGRLLREEPGYVVPTSLATRAPSARPSRLATLRAAASRDAWDTQERLWLVYASLLEGSRPSPSRNARTIVDRLSRLPRLVRR